MSSKQSYIVKDGNTLGVREGKRRVVYKGPGEEVKLTAEEAEQLTSVVRPKTHLDNQDGDSSAGGNGGKQPKQKPKKPEQVTKAIAGVTAAMMKEDPDRRNQSWWLADNGAPEVSALEERLGWGVSAEERDAAWAQFQGKQ